MRRSRMAVDNSFADQIAEKQATPNRHKEARDAMIDATIGVAHSRVLHRVCSNKLPVKAHRASLQSSAYHLASARIGPGIG